MRFPRGVSLFRQALSDLDRGVLVSVPQDHDLAMWEPSWDRPLLRRPDLLMTGQGMDGMRVVREANALH